MSEPDFHFTFHFSNFQYPLSQDTAAEAAQGKPLKLNQQTYSLGLPPFFKDSKEI